MEQVSTSAVRSPGWPGGEKGRGGPTDPVFRRKDRARVTVDKHVVLTRGHFPSSVAMTAGDVGKPAEKRGLGVETVENVLF